MENGSYLVERVVFALHVRVADTLAQDMFVKGTCEVTLEQLIVVYGFCNDTTDKFEVGEMVRIAVRRRIDHVRHSVPGWCGEQRVHRVENFSRDDHVPTLKNSFFFLKIKFNRVATPIQIIKLFWINQLIHHW